jgi:hypothetical protein
MFNLLKGINRAIRQVNKMPVSESRLQAGRGIVYLASSSQPDGGQVGSSLGSV